MPDGAEFLLVLTNLPDRETAAGIARKLVDSRLAACVNVLPAGTSVYRWRGEIETAQEVAVMIKTRAALYPQLEAALRACHPYELPEIIAVPLVRGLPPYLEWVAAETTPSSG
jgi:periplasmic divalent cation tolerance protein